MTTEIPEWLTDSVKVELGEWPDQHLARDLPVGRRTVTRWRNRLGISSCQAKARKHRADVVPLIQAQVDTWQRKFSVLKGWDIVVQHDPMEDCRTRDIDVEKKRAVILTCQGLPTDDCDESGVPRDYAVHEVLHVALAASGELGPKAGEEVLIQDLSWLLTYGLPEVGQGSPSRQMNP